MTLAIQELEARRPLDRKAVDTFLAEHSFPLQEGTTTTFVWRGPADRVKLRHWIYGLPSSQAFQRLEGTDLWYLSLELPGRARIEYKIDVIRRGRHRWIRDPLNEHLARDPFGANSVCHTQGYEIPGWTRHDPEARPGRLEELNLESQALGGEKTVQVYLPARFRESRRYPLLVVHDGTDYLRYASLRTVLDNLIYRMEIAPLVVALIDSPYRLTDYADDPRHGSFLAEELLPLLATRYPLLEEPRARGLMGASLGAVASLACAWRHPGVFGRLLLQSGSFAFSDVGTRHGRGPVFDPVVRFMKRFREEPDSPSERIFMSCGTFESLIYENRSIVPLLQSTGMQVKYEEARDGHNWENWRDRLRVGLAYLFPGPLWMVYE